MDFSPSEEHPYSRSEIVDVIRPVPAGPWPACVLVGAPGFHRHPTNVELAGAIARRGMVVLTPQFELGWVARAFGCLGSFVLQRAEELDVDAGRLVILGVSSGVGPAAVWAFGRPLEPDPRHCLSDLDPPSPIGYVGAGGLYGAFLWPLISREGHKLPVHLVHGNRDQSAPVRAAENLADALSETGYATELTMADGSHPDTFDPSHPLGQATIEAVIGLAKGRSKGTTP